MEGDRWSALFADLEAEAADADRADFRAEVADRTRREYALLRLVDRLRPAVGQALVLGLTAGSSVTGRLAELGADWLLVDEGVTAALVPMPQVLTVAGLGALSAPPRSPAESRAALDLRYALRRLARDRAPVSVALVDGNQVVGTCDRVGRDFVEVAEHPVGEPRRRTAVRQVRAVQLSAISVIRIG